MSNWLNQESFGEIQEFKGRQNLPQLYESRKDPMTGTIVIQSGKFPSFIPPKLSLFLSEKSREMEMGRKFEVFKRREVNYRQF